MMGYLPMNSWRRPTNAKSKAISGRLLSIAGQFDQRKKIMLKHLFCSVGVLLLLVILWPQVIISVMLSSLPLGKRRPICIWVTSTSGLVVPSKRCVVISVPCNYGPAIPNVTDSIF